MKSENVRYSTWVGEGGKRGNNRREGRRESVGGLGRTGEVQGQLTGTEMKEGSEGRNEGVHK